MNIDQPSSSVDQPSTDCWSDYHSTVNQYWIDGRSAIDRQSTDGPHDPRLFGWMQAFAPGARTWVRWIHYPQNWLHVLTPLPPSPYPTTPTHKTSFPGPRTHTLHQTGTWRRVRLSCVTITCEVALQALAMPPLDRKHEIRSANTTWCHNGTRHDWARRPAPRTTPKVGVTDLWQQSDEFRTFSEQAVKTSPMTRARFLKARQVQVSMLVCLWIWDGFSTRLPELQCRKPDERSQLFLCDRCWVRNQDQEFHYSRIGLIGLWGTGHRNLARAIPRQAQHTTPRCVLKICPFLD